MFELANFTKIFASFSQDSIDSAAICGLNTGGQAFVISQAAAVNPSPVLVITATTAQAERFAADLKFFLGMDKVFLFPAWEILPYDDISPYSIISGARINTLYQLILNEKHLIVVAPVRALIQRLIPKDTLARTVDQVIAGEEIDRDKFLKQLVEWGYEFEKMVEVPGTFAYRGGIVDIFQPHQPHPVRLEFFGDTVDSIRFFDASSQRSMKKIEELEILPAREYIWDKKSRLEVSARILNLKNQLSVPEDRINEILAKHTGQDMERIAQDTDRDFFLSADEAKEYGLVDEILQKPETDDDESDEGSE